MTEFNDTNPQPRAGQVPSTERPVPSASQMPQPTYGAQPVGSPDMAHGQPAGTHPVMTGQLPGTPTPGQLYLHTLRTSTARWWKPVVGIIGSGVVFFIASFVIALAAMLVGPIMRGEEITFAMRLTPEMYAATLLSLVFLIPLTWVSVRLLHGQPWGYTFSVTGRMRWGWLGRAVAVLVPVFAVYMVVFMQMGPDLGSRSPNWLTYAVIGALIMPFQAAAEEIFFRGYVMRGVGSWFASEKVGFAVGLLVSAVLFMLAHGAGDLWLNLYYFTFGATLAVAARLTGGLEVPIAMHVVNNVVSGVVGAYTTDSTRMFERSAGVGGPFMLIQIAFVAVCVAGLVWWSRKANTVIRVGEHSTFA